MWRDNLPWNNVLVVPDMEVSVMNTTHTLEIYMLVTRRYLCRVWKLKVMYITQVEIQRKPSNGTRYCFANFLCVYSWWINCFYWHCPSQSNAGWRQYLQGRGLKWFSKRWVWTTSGTHVERSTLIINMSQTDRLLSLWKCDKELLVGEAPS